MKKTEPDLALRTATRDDEGLLIEIYASTRQDVRSLGWAESQQEAFLRMQFTARQSAYGLQFPHAHHQVIELNGQAVGSLITARDPGEMRIVDIAVLQQFRRRGIAGETISRLQSDGLPISLHVDKVNVAAVEFYKKVGFKITAETTIGYQMSCLPAED